MNRPRSAKRFGIFDRKTVFQNCSAAVKALHCMKFVTVRHSMEIQPALVIETNGVHNEGVTFPFPDRVSKPSGIQVLWMSLPIRINPSDGVHEFMNYDHSPWRLQDCHRIDGRKHQPRNAGRYT